MSRNTIAAATLALILLHAVLPAQAAEKYFIMSGASWGYYNPPGGAWSDTEGGTTLVDYPSNGDTAFINNGGDCAVRWYDQQASKVILGYGAGDSGILSWRAGNTGDLDVIYDSAIANSGNMHVGYNGTGEVRMTTPDVTGKTLAVDADLNVGLRNGSSGLFIQQDGAVSVGNGIASGGIGVYIGRDSGSTGEYSLSGGSLDITGQGSRYLFVGQGGTGEFKQSGGSVSVDNYVRIGEGSLAHGTYTMTDGSLNANSSIIIGRAGDGDFVQSGGTVTAPAGQGIYLGGYTYDAGGLSGDGRWELSGTGQTHSLGFLRIGQGRGDGHFVQTGGTLDVDRDMILGLVDKSDTHARTGRYTVSAGLLDVDGTLENGGSGLGGSNPILGGYGVMNIVGDAASVEVDGYAQSTLGTLDVDIDGGLSGIHVDGEISLAGSLDVEFLSTPAVGDVFGLLINDDDDDVSGTFDGLPEGMRFTVDGMPLVISYEANLDGGIVGNDVTLTAVPEPGSLLVLVLAGLAVLLLRRR